MGSFGFVWFVRLRAVGCSVLSGSYGFTLLVAWFVLVRVIRQCAPLGSLCF